MIDDWPAGVQALYETLLETAPAPQRLSTAIAVWLPTRKVVAYNGPVLEHALDAELSRTTRQAILDNIAWHEYGHALSVTRASSEFKRQGPRLAELLPAGLRRVIEVPGSYGPREVFDEVIANVYALVIGRAVHENNYCLPTFLNPDVASAFTAVIPWPPGRHMTDVPEIHTFPAIKLGSFLRAMEDPEGTGNIDPDREREISRVEQRIAAPPESADDDE